MVARRIHFAAFEGGQGVIAERLLDFELVVAHCALVLVGRQGRLRLAGCSSTGLAQPSGLEPHQKASVSPANQT